MKKLFVLGITVAILISCGKEDDSPLDPDLDSNLNYMPLEIGNYWVYQHFDIDALGNETALSRIDSVIITRDTIISLKRYFILEGTNYPYIPREWGIVDMLRDSSGYLVNHEGHIRFAEDNFTDTLVSKIEIIGEDTLYTLTYKMEKPDHPITVPCGTYNVLNFRGTVYTPEKIPGIENPRYMNTYFADGTGKVLSTYFYLTRLSISEKRLIRYRIIENE
ncbi:hypothetical protein ES708_04692 [subsurface metagenome]